MSNPQTHVGTVNGTGAAINVPIGFQPDYVSITNQSSGAKLEWFRGMPAAGGFLRAAAGATTVLAVGGVSALNDKQFGEGFVIGTEATINANAQVLRFFATRSGPGAN